MAPLLPGDPASLGGFDLTDRIAPAGSGTVSAFEATNGLESYRIEAWESDADPEPELLAELLSDLQALGDNVLAPSALGVNEGWAWCAFPTAGLSSLARLLDDGPFVDDEWRELIRCLASAVAAVHESGRIVGRLTTGDAFVTSDGIPVLAYGTSALAQLLNDPRGSAQVLEWMAPEMLEGAPASQATDIFALGEIAAACATGRLPWGPAATPTATVMGRIAACAADLGGVPDAERRIIGLMLVADPSARPTAGYVSSLLGSGGLPDAGASGVAASASGAGDGTPSWTQRKGWVLGGVGAVVVLLAVVGGVVAMTSGGTDDTTASASTSSASPDADGDAGGADEESPDAEDSTGGSDDAGTTDDPAETLGPVTHTTRINYSNDSIPDKVFTDTLDWTFDVCLSDASLTSKANSSKIALYRMVDGKWKKQGATASASKGGRCGNGKVNVTIDRASPIPDPSRAGKGWSSCQKFRTVIPETPNFAKTNIDFCVQTRTDEG